jgi:hypothetical protein
LLAGLCAILMAAVAVSVGVVPDVPPDLASLKSVAQLAKAGPVELIHLARTLASVLISVCGTVPLPPGVVASATPVERLARLEAVTKAFCTPTFASAVHSRSLR